ncbi:MAG TPA: hypothetical protein VH370_15655 [Humisphaera sp.]|jgi:hypothetical protein|nr:hypothetical protein [Humisphaera sp.]
MQFAFWEHEGQPGRRVTTPHYVICSTIPDDQILAAVAQVMEGAFGQYRLLAPEVPMTDRPMECYLFANRTEWAAFTKDHTGEDAAVYLQINRGGYTIRDWYVAYYLGDIGTYSVAAHEGFHQYLGRHLKQRIPPFLEEGLACTFEDVTWEGKLPRWDQSINYSRMESLRHAASNGDLQPLKDLIGTHAGQIVNRSHEQIALFYAQCWAFARFVREADNGRHRAALAQMLADAASGTLVGDRSPPYDRALWNTRSAQPVLEHYLEEPLPAIDAEYRKFVAQIARQ